MVGVDFTSRPLIPIRTYNSFAHRILHSVFAVVTALRLVNEQLRRLVVLFELLLLNLVELLRGMLHTARHRRLTFLLVRNVSHLIRSCLNVLLIRCFLARLEVLKAFLRMLRLLSLGQNSFDRVGRISLLHCRIALLLLSMLSETVDSLNAVLTVA